MFRPLYFAMSPRGQRVLNWIYNVRVTQIAQLQQSDRLTVLLCQEDVIALTGGNAYGKIGECFGLPLVGTNGEVSTIVRPTIERVSTYIDREGLDA